MKNFGALCSTWQWSETLGLSYKIILIKLPDSFCSSFQHQTSDKKNDKNDIGKCSREVNHFAARLDALAKACKNNNPGEKNTQSQVPFDFANVSKLLKKKTGI